LRGGRDADFGAMASSERLSTEEAFAGQAHEVLVLWGSAWQECLLKGSSDGLNDPVNVAEMVFQRVV
jgi:hypothetical protein